jgi:predicted DNA-binding transcriptional regulator AlpA
MDTSTFFEKLVTKKQLAEALSISQSFINKLMVKEGLPYRQIGRAVRYSVREVVDWLNKRSRP